MVDFKLAADVRENFGKGFARRTRAAGRVPAVLYGHGHAPVHLSLDGHATMMALKHPNALLEITAEGIKELAVARDVQRHPVRRDILHVDLIIVKRGEKIEVEVPVAIVGEAGPGTMVTVDSQTVTVLADATQLPEHFEIDIEGRGVGENVLAGDIKLPAGVELVADAETLVVNVSAELTDEQLEAELESDADAAEDGAEADAEGEEAEQGGAEGDSEE